MLEPRAAPSIPSCDGKPVPPDRPRGPLPAQPERARRARTPRVMGLHEALSAWLAHQFDVLVRRAEHRMARSTTGWSCSKAIIVAFLNLDRVIEIIRTEDEPKPVMMAEFALTDRQAEAILNMRLRSLVRIEHRTISFSPNRRVERTRCSPPTRSPAHATFVAAMTVSTIRATILPEVRRSRPPVLRVAATSTQSRVETPVDASLDSSLTAGRFYNDLKKRFARWLGSRPAMLQQGAGYRMESSFSRVSDPKADPSGFARGERTKAIETETKNRTTRIGPQSSWSTPTLSGVVRCKLSSGIAAIGTTRGASKSARPKITYPAGKIFPTGAQRSSPSSNPDQGEVSCSVGDRSRGS